MNDTPPNGSGGAAGPGCLVSGWVRDPSRVWFSDQFDVDPAVLESHGAYDISVVTDVPVFIDPFLLFNSEDGKYQVPCS